MNALAMNKYLHIDTLNPKKLDKNQYYFDFNWETVQITYDTGECYYTRIIKLQCYIKTKDPIIIGTFILFRDKYNNYNFKLGDYKVSNTYYTPKQIRYYDLNLPIDPNFISFLKKEYNAHLVKKKKRNKRC